MKIENWAIYGLFSFFSTLSVYNGQRLLKSNKKNITPWLNWVNKNKKSIFLFVSLSSILAGVFFLRIQKLNALTFSLMSISTIVSVFYVLRIKNKNLRELPFVKIHLIAFTWVTVLVVFPLLNESIDANVFLYAVAHYVYVVAITIPFDIRDLKYDAVEQKTIPQLIGVNGSKVLALLLLSCFVSLAIILRAELLYTPLFITGIIIQSCLIIFMNESRSDVYCAGLIDGSISIIGASYFFL